MDGASDSTPPPLDNELDSPVKVPITHSIQNKTWRDVHNVLLSTITLKNNYYGNKCYQEHQV